MYVNGKAANYARSTLQRRFFDFDNETMSWNTSEYDWILTTPGLDRAEIRGINSFTDRYAPIEAVGDKNLTMKQHLWRNNVFGCDTIFAPNADFGFHIQNALALLDEGGEFFLDSEAGVVYYMPLEDEDINTVDTWLGILEGLVYVQGTLEEPIHDITFSGINFAHTTWLLPGQGYGYIDQQTGAYICDPIIISWHYQQPDRHIAQSLAAHCCGHSSNTASPPVSSNSHVALTGTSTSIL